MFNVHRIEKVVGPVFGPKSDFFGVAPGVFPGGLGIVVGSFGVIPRVFSFSVLPFDLNFPFVVCVLDFIL